VQDNPTTDSVRGFSVGHGASIDKLQVRLCDGKRLRFRDFQHAPMKTTNAKSSTTSTTSTSTTEIKQTNKTAAGASVGFGVGAGERTVRRIEVRHVPGGRSVAVFINNLQVGVIAHVIFVNRGFVNTLFIHFFFRLLLR
jgi:hypothetical protein